MSSLLQEVRYLSDRLTALQERLEAEDACSIEDVERRARRFAARHRLDWDNPGDRRLALLVCAPTLRPEIRLT